MGRNVKYKEGAVRVSYFMPTRMKKALEKHAKKHGTTEVDVVHQALRVALKMEPVVDQKDEAFG